MAKGLVQHIAETLKSYLAKVLLIENNDRFLYRNDIQEALNTFGIEIADGTPIQQRIRYEMREKDGILVLLSQDNSRYLEDMVNHAAVFDFHIANHLQGFHVPSIMGLELRILNELFQNQPLINLSRSETEIFVRECTEAPNSEASEYDLTGFANTLSNLLKEATINWSVVSRVIAGGIARTIGTSKFDEVYLQVNIASRAFQDELLMSYHQIKSSSPVKKPRIVSKILDYLDFNYREKKVALIVVDGMALWQYEMIKSQLPGKKHENVIYSWLPSITQLSRQAIFRGDTPKTAYRQRPSSEEKLWKKFWKAKGVPDFELDYQHERIDLSAIDLVSKLAIVLKDLDDKMHSSTDYQDLLVLTENWFERSKLSKIVGDLLSKNFVVFLTADHGNVEAKGWRGLTGREKLGTNLSGSRSERHIEYAESWLCQEFIASNPDMGEAVVVDDRAIYFKTNMSFSNKESLVTHGGSHLLEVLIPFVEIRNDGEDH